MKNLMTVLFAGAMMATVAFAQENSDKSAPPAEQKQAESAEMKCCGKDCCKHMTGKKEKGSKKDKSAAMNCCK
jgi:hypothetical protein